MNFVNFKNAVSKQFKQMTDSDVDLFRVDVSGDTLWGSYLSSFPEETMRALYNFIEEEYFDHDFNNVETSFDEYDSEANIKGLHTIRKKVEYKKRESIIPPDIQQKYSGLEVWR